MRLIAVIGARPNFMRIASLVPALRCAGIDIEIAFAGSRTSHRECAERSTRMLFHGAEVPTPIWFLDQARQEPGPHDAIFTCELDALLRSEPCDAVLVVGDEDESLAAALCATRAGIPVVHLEAGLRCGRLTEPHEVNRVLISRIAAMHLAPSECALANLDQEGVEARRVHFVGSTLAETVLDRLDVAREGSVPGEFGLCARGYLLGAFHCDDNTDDASRLASIIEGLTRSGYPTLIPDTNDLRGAIRTHGIQVPRSVRMVDPVTYDDFLSLERGAAAIVTDSGGVQDEACIIGTPCVTVREQTERTATVTSGANRLSACTAAALCEQVRLAAESGARWRTPSRWDRAVSQRIVRAISRGVRPLS